MEVKLLSCVQLFVTPWTVAHQDPPSMGFSRQEYWSEQPFPSPGIFSENQEANNCYQNRETILDNFQNIIVTIEFT